MTAFKFPWQYDFPPFFTIQKALQTREKQLEAWARLVIDYAQHNKIYTMDIAEATTSELFSNLKLNRRLSSEGIATVLQYLEQKKLIEFTDSSRTRFHVFWRRPDVWASTIYQWAVENAFLNTPLTLYEITQGDDTVNESFHNLEREILMKALNILADQRRAQLLNIGSENEGVLEIVMPHQQKSISIDEKDVPSFFRYEERIQEGDTVIVYVTYGQTIAIEVKRGQTLMMKYGALRHEFIIGKKWGSKISSTAGYVYVLRPSSELWTRSLPRRTQILYTADCSLILQLLDAKPGAVICESGTGSGSLSHAITMCIAPNGHLYTHDIDESRTKKIEQEFKTHGLSEITTAVVQNVCTDGFFVTNACDGVFLDVPAPWEAIKFAAKAISCTRGGRLVSFSPCIEQVQRACQAMKKEGFIQIETIEIVPQTHKVVSQHRQTLAEFEDSGDVYPRGDASSRKRKADGEPQENSEAVKPLRKATAIVFPYNQPTHTGYLTHATLLPVDEVIVI
ncbi:unnamed protein product [Caenorhabditis bovis]|uniref:Vacuolar protein-sorting-associated protein 25 n=1 Tax=Caenorhabditis bovis TaxID=2654633 RepID=A0A8S1F965_9PELO|nr:unnamed protein product [Caenorhabditis bovis]